MSLSLPPDLMVSVSGFRGRVGTGLTPELAAGVAARFGAFLRARGESGPVYVGRDSRTSGPMLSRSVISGLQSVGAPVVDLGMVATPTLLLAVEEGRGGGGVGVTASHNPAEWNGFKLVGPGGTFLDRKAMEEFLTSLEEEPSRAGWDALGTLEEDEEATDRHLERVLDLPHVEVDRIRERGFQVVVDCVHGAGGRIMPRLLELLGCEVDAMGFEPDGRFPRDPEPVPENLGPLGERVVDRGAEVGLAVDPDVDRLTLVDETGSPVGEDYTLALAAAEVLRRRPGPVVTNLSTSRVVEDVARAHGSVLIRAPVGEIHVARRMEEEGAVVGGEGNGGVILPDLHLTRDAPLAAALLLQHLLEEGGGLSEAVARWPRYRIVKEKMTFPREALEDAYAVLGADFNAPDEDLQDGLRLEWPGRSAWLHVRPSGTEPVVRLISEAPTLREARELVERARKILEGVA